MKVTLEICMAIGKAADKAGSNADLGRLVNITGATIGKWRSNKIRHIEDASWERILPYIKPYLPPGVYVPVTMNQSCVCSQAPLLLKQLLQYWDDMDPLTRNLLSSSIGVAVSNVVSTKGAKSGN